MESQRESQDILEEKEWVMKLALPDIKTFYRPLVTKMLVTA